VHTRLPRVVGNRPSRPAANRGIDTQSVYRNIIDRFCQEIGATGVAYGDMPAAGMRREHIVKLMAAHADKLNSGTDCARFCGQ
jgi:hypothetical protein